MEKREAGRKFSRTVPVVIENHENVAKKTKLMVPSNYTAGHLVNILRSRMHLLPYHPVFLFLKSKQIPILMSKCIGHLYLKYQDEKGLLRLILAGQASFGFRGNIRAIRFRQKWIENLHNTLHQDSSGSSYSGAPPPYFPLEPPSTTNFGIPVIDLDDVNDSVEPLPINGDIFDYLGNAFAIEVEESFHTSEVSNSWQSSSTTGSSQSSTFTHSSQSVPTSTTTTISAALSEWADPWLSSSLADPWLPSATHSGHHNPVGENNGVFQSEEDFGSFFMELDQVASNMFIATIPGNSSNSSIAHSSANVQPADPEVIPPVVNLYDSDSDFYDSDKEMDN